MASSPHSSLPSAKTSTSSHAHAVSRSNELLSCAKTAVKIAQRKHASSPPPKDPHSAWWTVKLSDLRLYDTGNQHPEQSHEVLEDGLSLLHTMEGELKHLEGLVRRRGHTNDPTEAISLSVKRLELDTQELMELIQTMIPPTARGQRNRHWQILQQWFQSVAQQQGARLKEILKVRGKVLAEQAQRRKRFQASSNTTSNTAKAQLDSPLFTAPTHRPAPPPRPVPPPAQSHAQQPLLSAAVSNGSHPPPAANGGTSPAAHANGFHNGSAAPAAARTAHVTAPSTAPPTTTTNTNNSNNKNAASSTQSLGQQRPRPTSGGYGSYYGSASTTTTSNAYGGGGGGATSGGYVGVGTGGYGGSASNASIYAGTGSSGMMRRRHQGVASATNQDEQQTQNFQVQEQVQLRQQERQSQQRLQEARQAEKSLATLGTMFGKMSTLISQQAEVVDKVEDDVEAAMVDVSAGHDEITTLYSIKKGNRALIIKVFAILIFFIIFMRIYKK